MPREDSQNGSHLPLQTVSGHPGRLQAPVEGRRHLQKWFVGMMEAEPIVPLLHVGLCDHILDVEIDGGVVYRDDLTGQVLDPKLVRAARQKELEFYESKSVWSLKAFEEARRRTGKPPVTVRWVDVNKGDDINPNIRS